LKGSSREREILTFIYQPNLEIKDGIGFRLFTRVSYDLISRREV
jgi:hypothetical protein